MVKDNQPVPECIPGGVPPCPLCPEQANCAYAKRILITDPKVLMNKMKDVTKL
jgi:hypothetical protein